MSKKEDFKNSKIFNIPSINNFHPITILKKRFSCISITRIRQITRIYTANFKSLLFTIKMNRVWIIF